MMEEDAVTNKVERDSYGLVRRAETVGAVLECRPDSHCPQRPWVLRLPHGRHMRLGTLELEKVAYIIGLTRAVEETEARP